MSDEISRPRKIHSAAKPAIPTARITSAAAYVSQLYRVRFQTPQPEVVLDQSLETKPLRYATSFQGASTASAGSRSVCCAKSVILLIARRSRRAVNQSGRRTSKSLDVNCSVTSTSKTSAQDLFQTRCANSSLSERTSSSTCRANAVVSPQ